MGIQRHDVSQGVWEGQKILLFQQNGVAFLLIMIPPSRHEKWMNGRIHGWTVSNVWTYPLIDMGLEV